MRCSNAFIFCRGGLFARVIILPWFYPNPRLAKRSGGQSGGAFSFRPLVWNFRAPLNSYSGW